MIQDTPAVFHARFRGGPEARLERVVVTFDTLRRSNVVELVLDEKDPAIEQLLHDKVTAAVAEVLIQRIPPTLDDVMRSWRA